MFRVVICIILYSFVVYLYVNGSGSITSVGEERANLSVVVYYYFETEQGINKEFRKHVFVFFKMNSSLGSFLLYYYGDERVSVPWVVINKTLIETVFYFP